MYYLIISLLASGALVLPQDAGAIKYQAHMRSGRPFSTPFNLTSSGPQFLRKKELPCSLFENLDSVIPSSLRKKDIPPEQLNFLRFVIVGGVLLMASVAVLAMSFDTTRRVKSQKEAEDALQNELRTRCSQPVSKRNGQTAIYEEQVDAELRQKFEQAQAHRPLETAIVHHADVEPMKQRAARERMRGTKPATITWSARTTTDDYMAFAVLIEGKQAAGLSYADGCRPGGGFRDGRGAVEESLCCGSYYYPSLKAAHDTLHVGPEGAEENHFGFPDVRSDDGKIQIRETNRARPRQGSADADWRVWNPEQEFQKYATVLVTHNVRRYRLLNVDLWQLLSPEDQHYVTFVSAAAPRWAAHTGGSSGHLTNATEEESDMLFNGKDSSGENLFENGAKPLREAMESIVLAPKLVKPDLQVLVLGPWGTGPLRGNFEKSVHYLLRVLVETDAIYLYDEVHFNFFANTRSNTLQELLERGLQLTDNAPDMQVVKITEPLACFRGFVPSRPAA